MDFLLQLRPSSRYYTPRMSDNVRRFILPLKDTLPSKPWPQGFRFFHIVAAAILPTRDPKDEVGYPRSGLGKRAGGEPWVPETFLARFPVSVKSLQWPARKVFSRGFGLRSKLCRPSANTENFRRTREKPLVPRVRGGGEGGGCGPPTPSPPGRFL